MYLLHGSDKNFPVKNLGRVRYNDDHECPKLRGHEQNVQNTKEHVNADIVADTAVGLLFVGGRPDVEPESCGQRLLLLIFQNKGDNKREERNVR